MPIRSIQQSFCLPAGRTRSWVLANPMRLQIARGCIWLTISGKEDDYWLSDGDAMLLPAHRKVVVEACKADSVLGLIELSGAVPHSVTVPRLRAGMRVYTES